MVVTLGQQYNIGEKPTVILVVSYIQRIGCQPPKKLFYTVANPARGLPNIVKNKNKKSDSENLGKVVSPARGHWIENDKIYTTRSRQSICNV